MIQDKKLTRKERKAAKKAKKMELKAAKEEKVKQFNGIRDSFLKSVFKVIAQSPVFLFYSLALGFLGLILLGIALTSLYYVGVLSFFYFMSLFILLVSGWVYAFNYYLNGENKTDEK
ncbi:hypothetical protein QR692_09965 [Lactococcus petauri]|uniref:hypothetical protein n=1 Tax=Lactococcus petauri TaxID=1940789 RepID=UPI002078DB78|nr:hypothetical protein [Lactococcus petauri]USI65308.1 hypothetical protein LMK05_10850 [Lactococcus petauri]USI67803.1 hypothetical protein LMK04_10085 [Lactococcus petauri]WJE12464.1 hypothetical protein QR692_09965 [Lactococcus petauri]